MSYSSFLLNIEALFCKQRLLLTTSLLIFSALIWLKNLLFPIRDGHVKSSTVWDFAETLSFKLYHEYPLNTFRFLQVWNGVLCQKEVTLCVGVHQGVVMSPCGISGFSVVHYSGIIYLDKINTLYDSLLYNYKFVNRNIYISFIVFKINSFLVKPIKLFFYSIGSTL